MNTGHPNRSSTPQEEQAASMPGEEQLSSAILAWTNASAPQGIFTTDTELRITSWNQWLENSTHLKAEQVVGKALVEIIPSLVERRLDHCYRDALRGESKLLSRSLHGYLLPLPSTVLSNRFTHMQQSARIGPLEYEGEICGTITLIEDVTEREWHHAVLLQARQRSDLLARTLARLLTAREPEELVRDIFTQIAGPLGLDCCIYHVIEPNSTRFQLHSSTGLSLAEQQQCALLELGHGLCGTVLQTRERLVVNHLQQHRDPNVHPCKDFGLRAFAGFPLLMGSRLLGSLAFGTRGRESFTEDEVQFLFTLSQYAAIALDRARQEQNLRESEERFRNMAATVPDIIFTAAADGSRDYVNSRFYEVTGMSPEGGLGLGWMQAVAPEDIERVHRTWQHCAETGESYCIEYRMRDRQGKARWFYARAQPVFNESNRLVKWFGAVTDIEELKQAHEELARAQGQLAQHAALLEKTVNERTSELRETISQLESFSYTVAHDLRAPIRNLESYAEIMLEDYGNRLDEPAKTILGNMSRAARRLDALTRDVLNYTKVATQKTELVPVDPAEIVQDVLVMNPALQTPNAEVAIVRPIAPVLAHPTLLSQCFSNLLGNAVKFVKPGVIPHVVIGSEAVSVGKRAQRPGGHPPRAASHYSFIQNHSVLQALKPAARPRIRLWVQDNGIGIKPEMQSKVFGVFERGKDASRIPGTGIGLAIVAKAVERMNGTYGVDSRAGEGSRFWIELTAA